MFLFLGWGANLSQRTGGGGTYSGLLLSRHNVGQPFDHLLLADFADHVHGLRLGTVAPGKLEPRSLYGFPACPSFRENFQG